MGNALKVTVTDQDRGFRTLVKNLSSVAEIEVGVFGKKAARRHPDHGRKGAITVGQIAAMLEFGLGGQKQRSFIRAWFDANEANLLRVAAKVMRAVAYGADPKIVVPAMAAAWVDAIRIWVAQGNVKPENAPSTVKWKGHGLPAIGRTGALMEAIDSRVRLKPNARGAAAGLVGWLSRKAKGK